MSEYEDNYGGTAVHLIDGSMFDYEDPDATEYDLHNIAHNLARESRYGGAYEGPHYSVAEHAVLVSFLVDKYYREPEKAMAALHHDDPEFVMKDLPTPFKNWLKAHGAPIKELETAIAAGIARKLGLDVENFDDPTIKEADVLAYAAEIVVLKPQGHGPLPEVDAETLAKVTPLIQALSAPQAEQSYMMRHQFLAGRGQPDGDQPRPQPPATPPTVSPSWDDGTDPYDPRNL